MSTEQTNANMYTVGTNMNGKKAVWKKGDSNGAVCSMTGRDEDEDNAHLIAELFNVKMETGLTPRQLLDRLNIYESKFIEISALLERFTNGGIQIAKSISDNPLGGGFKQINPLYSENKELKEQRDELLKVLDEIINNSANLDDGVTHAGDVQISRLYTIAYNAKTKFGKQD